MRIAGLLVGFSCQAELQQTQRCIKGATTSINGQVVPYRMQQHHLKHKHKCLLMVQLPLPSQGICTKCCRSYLWSPKATWWHVRYMYIYIRKRVCANVRVCPDSYIYLHNIYIYVSISLSSLVFFSVSACTSVLVLVD